MDEMQWVRPSLVAQIRFVEWTGDGHLRHAAFLGLRTDKPARQIHRER
jgi:bifunctional non-homologous end joining protein LigD